MHQPRAVLTWGRRSSPSDRLGGQEIMPSKGRTEARCATANPMLPFCVVHLPNDERPPSPRTGLLHSWISFELLATCANFTASKGVLTTEFARTAKKRTRLRLPIRLTQAKHFCARAWSRMEKTSTSPSQSGLPRNVSTTWTVSRCWEEQECSSVMTRCNMATRAASP